MICITIELREAEAKALRAMCHRFTFDDALHHLHGVRNVKPDSLCEAVTRLHAALNAARNSP